MNRLWLQQLLALISKEFQQIVRDPSSYLVAGVLPFLFLLIFGYGVSLDPGVLRIAIIDEGTGAASHSLAAAFVLLSASCTRQLPEAQIPIMAWYCIPAADATPERYRELADCGFTINFSHLRTLEELQQSLDCAREAGVKAMAT